MRSDRPTEQYKNSTRRSEELHRRAAEVIPGGDTRSSTHHQPYPSFVSEATGHTLTTVDNEELVDFMNNYTVNIHGHAYQPIVDAVQERYQYGNSPGAPVEEAIELAECLVDRTSSIERIRFCNSGTEATMHAIRGAMAYTGNDLVLKNRGGYHGSHDTVQIAVHERGLENPGIPQDIEKRVEIAPYNDIETLKAKFEKYGEQLACFITEPIMGSGGMIPATEEYLRTARDLTENTDTVLIFDEVISYRLSTGGAQQVYDVEPDLTTLGKIIGGGLPVGAFGGRSDVMNIFHPVEGCVSQSGTFSGNPATMVGGLKSLENLDESRIERLNNLGETLRERLSSIISDKSLPMKVTGFGSLLQIHFTDSEVINSETSTSDHEKAKRLFLLMRNRGVYMSPRGMACLSTPMAESEIQRFIDAFDNSVKHLNFGPA